jgi:general stress protein YciG
MADDTSKRGFASMDPDQQREIASKGGKSQGKQNNPGNFANDPQKASEAGRKGGQRRGNQSQNDNVTDDLLE